VPVMFSYSGWNAAVYVAEEIRDRIFATTGFALLDLYLLASGGHH